MSIVASSDKVVDKGLLWELNPGPLAPEARIIPLDQAAGAIYPILALLGVCIESQSDTVKVGM